MLRSEDYSLLMVSENQTEMYGDKSFRASTNYHAVERVIKSYQTCSKLRNILHGS